MVPSTRRSAATCGRTSAWRLWRSARWWRRRSVGKYFTSNVDVFSNSAHGWFGEKDFQIEKVLFLGPLPPGPTTKIFTPDILCENIDEFKIRIFKRKGLVITWSVWCCWMQYARQACRMTMSSRSTCCRYCSVRKGRLFVKTLTCPGVRDQPPHPDHHPDVHGVQHVRP